MLRKRIRKPPEVWKNMDFSVFPLYGEGKEKRCGNCCHHTVFYLSDKIWNPDLFAALCVAAHELVYATCRIHQFVLTRIEGM